MSFYVKRAGTHPDTGAPRVGWTGPIRSQAQAHREADAWRSANWTAEVLPSTDEVRAEIRKWERAVAARHFAGKGY